ncbi:MAG: ABC transporter ATP-binding protein/permease, partial [Clostridia bacterium]|nr:ABC transporter ATP-binding protein/permease [Clostridia bacterium]
YILMLELKKITKNYKVADTETTVLKGISLTLRNSEFVSVLGPSGCGKTTMLNIIGGLDKATSGELLINGKSTQKYNDHDWDTYRNHTIGFVFQSYNLIPHQTVLKNVELALSIGGISKSERRRRAKEALIKVGLEDHMNKKPNQLSGGQCQRVSIARALVTNPDIILADEPTGALDTETSVQVMDILKEISKDRLVLMVTHNPDLAEKYSTRIVRMLDGAIIQDSNPVKEDEYQELLCECEEKQAALSPVERRKAEKKASMKLHTSIGLSCSNLLTKKGRTFITSLACSIGIMGIAIILSVSAGMQSYVNVLQQDSSSSNYIMISSTSASQISFGGNNNNSVNLEEYPDSTDGIYLYTEEADEDDSSTQILNDAYINYLEENINGDTEETSLVLGISYTRSVGLNLISDNGGTYQVVDTSNFSELLNNSEYMQSQYTVLDGSFPTEYNEVALVVDSYNRISTDILDELGIYYESSAGSIDYGELVGKTFRLVANDDYYIKTSYGDGYIYYTPDDSSYDTTTKNNNLSQAYNSGETITITAVIRQNEDASSDWVSSGIAYTQALTDYVLAINADSEIVEYQKTNPEYNVLTGKNFENEAGGAGGLASLFGSTSSSYESNMVLLGGDSTPTSIIIYPKDFDSKDKIIEVLDYWNDSEIYKIYGNEKDSDGNYIADSYKVTYTDVSALIVSMLSSLIDIITYALIAFSAVSLVVSSIMIAIITYASVIERTKEIGTIRSLGGRKRDVSAVFIAEACIIGLVSAAIALLVTLGVNALINLILGALVGVSDIATLKISTALEMVALAVGLNLIASIIPARIAAKKDPVVALRTE